MQRDLRTNWERDGFVVVDLRLPAGFVDRVKQDMQAAPPEYRTQREYERDGHWRIFQGWRYSAAIAGLARLGSVAMKIQRLTGRKPVPFQTLNFIHSTQQALHQDAIHFDADPPGSIVGAWVALEDVTEDAGPLVVCPGSHKEPRWDLTDLGHPLPVQGEEYPRPRAYEHYERFLAKLAQRYETVPVVIPAGHAVIWHGNLLHGGSPILREGATRWSQATHYVLEGFTRFYCPLYGTDKELRVLEAAA